jgi:hypothetical protein
MARSATEIAQIVWAETSDLGPSGPGGKGDVNAVRRSIAQLAASTVGDGFPKRKA